MIVTEHGNAESEGSNGDEVRSPRWLLDGEENASPSFGWLRFFSWAAMASGFEKRLYVCRLQWKAPSNLPCRVKKCRCNRGRRKRVRCL